jgi:GNAT superfamily N-acetyltransferase/superfamily II DNA or RNA helicase
MDKLTERNSTSFPKELVSALESIKKDKDDPLRYHQRLVYEFVIKNPRTRGLQIFHKMGAGKTITGASLAEGLKEQDVKRRIIVMAAKSLHANFRKDIIKYKKLMAEKGKDEKMSEEAMAKYIEENYQFISLNASNMLTQVHKAIKKDADLSAFDDNIITEEEAEEFAKLDKIGNLDNSVLIIDEAHNLFNAITNGSKNAIGLYRLIMQAKNIKLIFLTGTPIVNDPFEFAICMNMIAGPMGKHSNGSPITLFGEDYADFTKYFVGAIRVEMPDPIDPNKTIQVAQPHIKNREKFINRIVGLVSYYGADDKDQIARYPEQLETIISKVPMSPKQYASYISARDREIEETSKGTQFSKSGHKKPLQKPEGMSSSYRVRSRQFSNFLFPNYASRTYKDARGYARYEKFPDKLKEENLRVRGSDGKGDNEANFGLEVWSPKIMKMLEHIQAHSPFKFYSDKLAPNATKKEPAKKPKKKIKVKGKGEMELKVREIQKSDWDKIKEAHEINFKEKFTQGKDEIGYVAIDHKKVTGYATISPKTHIVRYLRVIPEYQRRGIGKVLMTMIMERYPNAKLTIPKSDGIDVLKAYEEYGFHVVKETSTAWYTHRKVVGKGDIEIREASPHESSKVVALHVSVFEDVPNFDIDNPDTKAWIAKEDDNIIGYAILKPGYSSISKKRSGVNFMVALGVKKENRRQNVGKQLLETILTQYPKMYLKIERERKTGAGAKKFYEDSEFFVYRASPTHWYMRRIKGGVPAAKPKGGIGPGLIYSQFIDSGVGLMGKVLSAYGFKEIKNLDDALKHKKGASFAIISGDVDPELRAEIVRIFNSSKNKQGEHLSILLVTSTGAEGLDLKCVRHIHILEPYWHWSRLAQVFARGVRMDSHITLPEKERNVQPYIYLSDYPGANQLKELTEEMDEGLDHIRKQMEKEDTTDVTLYGNSVQNQIMIDSFLQAIKEASIDCNAHYKGKLECRLCAPTGEALFVPDLDKDMNTRSPCAPLKEETVKAKSISITIEIDGKKEEKDFAYLLASKEEVEDDGRQVHIFEYDPKLDAHSEIFEDHEFYDEIYAAIKKREKKLL